VAHVLRSRWLLFAPALVALALFVASCGNSAPSSSSSAASFISKGLSAESSGKLHEAEQDFMTAAATDHKDANAYFQLGVLYQHRLNEPAKAATAYKNALVHQHNDKAAMYNLAVLETLGAPQTAQNLYARLLILDPKNPRVNYNLGLLLIAENQPVPGHALLKKALSLDPSLAKQVPAGITP
jgi:tetratricopeptide (TPR) repeat protein